MNNQDCWKPETSYPSARATTQDPASIATIVSDTTLPLTVVAAQTADGNIINVDDKIPTTLLNGTRQPNFRILFLLAKIYHGNDKYHEIS